MAFSLRSALWAALLIISLGACSGQQQAEPQPAAGSNSTASPVSGLPPLPADRAAAGLTEYLVNGIAVFDKSSGALENGTALELPAVQYGDFEWAIYAFAPGASQPDSIHLQLEAEAGSELWIGLADYGAGRWALSGPFSKSKTLPLDESEYLSPQGNLYLAVIVQGTGSASVEALSLRTINPDNQAPVAELSVAGTQLSGNAPHAVDFDASASSDDESISHYLWDFDGDGEFENLSYLPDAAHLYADYGSFEASVSVVDAEGAHSEASVSITVNALPVARLSADKYVANKGETIWFDASLSSDADGGIAGYEWDFDGDQIFSEAGAEAASAGQPAVQRFWDTPGPKFITVRATDDRGWSSTARADIELRGWAVVTISDEVSSGARPSICDVNGHPAISYIGSLKLAYAYSLTDHGGEPDEWVVADVKNGLFGVSDLCMHQGRPAIAYYNGFTAAIEFARSSTPDGAEATDWSTQEISDYSDLLLVDLALQVIAGAPAVAANLNSSATLSNTIQYLRASNAEALDWNSIEVAELAEFDVSIDLATVDGHPALCYPDNNAITFNRSLSTTGMVAADWLQPLHLPALSPYQVNIEQVAGRPALLFSDSGDAELHYAISRTAAGASSADWEVLSLGGECPLVNLALLGGRPAAAFFSATDSELQLLWSGSVDGADPNDWSLLSVDETLPDTRALEAAEIAGRTCIAYGDYDAGLLKFAILFGGAAAH